MTIVIGNRAWQMDEEKAEGLLKIASEKVPQGIYAIRKGDFCELLNKPMTVTQMKRTRAAYRRQGMKVYCNGL